MFPESYTTQATAPSIVGRITAHDRDSYLLILENQLELRGRISGALRHNARQNEMPVVGDYVCVQTHTDFALIERVLQRKNLFARRGVDGSHDLQAIASNLDTLFITIAVNKDFNIRRLERYLVAARAFDVPVAVVLTKIDLTENTEQFLAAAKSISRDIPILPVSSEKNIGMDQFGKFRGKERTFAFVGSSGAGKSTLINNLSRSQRLEVSEIREHDDRGKHTTTRRMMLHLDDGTAIIDTPGMREFALADATDGVADVFQDIIGIADDCRFRDCRHESEPGCAVRESIDQERLTSWRKLGREAAFEARKTDRLAAAIEKERWKSIGKNNRVRERERKRL